jgi:hypothetical protein
VRPQAFVLPMLATLAACTDSDPVAPTAPPSPAEAVAAAAGWQPRADYPTDLYGAVSASVTNPTTLRSTLYVIGGNHKPGTAAGSLTDAVKAYDPVTNTWTVKAKLPVRLYGANQAVELGGKIYVSGGFSRRFDATRGVWRLTTEKSLYVYTAATNTWARKADMPITTVRGVAAAYNGLIYVATRCFDDAVCGDFNRGAVWRYNPGTDRWTLVARGPHETFGEAGGMIGGKLYLVDDLGATDVYDVTTKVWTAGPQRPYRYCTPSSATFQAKVFLGRCANDDGTDPAMLVLDPKAGTWTKQPPAPLESFATMSRVGINGVNRLELVGGPEAGSNWQYVP